MERVGYDADSQSYQFRDSDGSYWESEEGNELGRLHRAGTSGRYTEPLDYDESAAVEQRAGFWRYFGPLAVIVLVVLLLVMRSLSSASAKVQCSVGLEQYVIEAGDTCWELAESMASTVDGLVALNPQLRCDSLRPGQQICIPDRFYEGPGKDG